MAAEDQPRSTDATDGPILRAHRRPSAVIVFVTTAALALTADLVTKHWAFHSLLAEQESLSAQVQAVQVKYEQADRLPPSTRRILQELHLSRPVMPGVKLTLSTNPGVVFGLPMPRALVLAATVIVLGVVGWFFATSDATQRCLHAALGLILAGALGNQYDRLFSVVRLPGVDPIRYEVRDFIDCSGLYYPWVFNVADALLVVGVAAIILHSLVCRPSASPQSTD